MSNLIIGSKKAKMFGFWQIAGLAVALLFPFAVRSDNTVTTTTNSSFQTVYTETPVASYYAQPNDPNFVPETDFMERADSLDYDNNILMARKSETNKHPGVAFGDRPAVVCRNFGCTKLNDKITRTFLFNSIANAFMVNSHSSVHVCEADPFSRSCLQSGISFPARVGIANAMMKIPTATISGVSISAGLSKATIGMTYDLLANGIAIRCEPTMVDIVVPVNDQATLATREFKCNLTADGVTNVSLLMNVDYIDLDYGIIGGYYSLGMQGPTYGGGTGYALLKTEYASNNMQMRAATTTSSSKKQTVEQAGLQVIQPGEYAVEPMTK